MTENHNKEAVRRIYDAFNERDVEALEALLAPDFTDHTTGAGGAGAEAVKSAWREMWQMYSGLRVDVEEVVIEGERVAARVTFRDADGAVLGHMAEFIHVKEGKVTDLWNLACLGLYAG